MPWNCSVSCASHTISLETRHTCGEYRSSQASCIIRRLRPATPSCREELNYSDEELADALVLSSTSKEMTRRCSDGIERHSSNGGQNM